MRPRVSVRRDVDGYWHLKCPGCDFDNRGLSSWDFAIWWANSHARTHWAVSAA